VNFEQEAEARVGRSHHGLGHVPGADQNRPRGFLRGNEDDDMKQHIFEWGELTEVKNRPRPFRQGDRFFDGGEDDRMMEGTRIDDGKHTRADGA
jgi:hypothetical protein